MESMFKHVAVKLSFLVLLLAVIYFFPFKNINWGSVQYGQSRSVTVTGTATKQKTNELATFTVGVNTVNDSKEKAVKEVNDKITAITQSVKDFGVNEADIKTQNLNIYQTQESYYEDGRQKQRLGQWNVSNNLEITLRDVAKSDAFTNLISSSGATTVYGPNFSLENGEAFDAELSAKAMENALEKATALAKSSNAKVGKVVTVVDGGSYAPPGPMQFAKGAGGGGGADLSVGSSTISKNLTVTFELK